ncbi:MAG: DUF5694 domain-containing protein [Betaproteobacteria bacterium]
MKVLARRVLALCLALFVTWTVAAEGPVPANAPSPGRVMLIGLFHFDNPGLDAVKFTPVDVTRPAEQAYLAALATRIAQFKPTRVLLEYPPANDKVMNQRYTDYLAGRFELKLNEIYQLGFRIAKASGLTQVHGFDERDTPADGALWEYLPKQEPETMKALEAMITELSGSFQADHRTLSLRELLQKNNSAEFDRLNKDFYLWLNPVGAEKRKFLGADASAHWWQRNFRMYANIQRHATPGERVVVIAGQGHTAILRDLLRIDMRRAEESVQGYF